MHITEIKFRMNVEVAPYRHEHVEITVALNKGENVDKAVKLAKDNARKILGVDITDEDIKQAKRVLNAAKRLGY